MTTSIADNLVSDCVKNISNSRNQNGISKAKAVKKRLLFVVIVDMFNVSVLSHALFKSKVVIAVTRALYEASINSIKAQLIQRD